MASAVSSAAYDKLAKKADRALTSLKNFKTNAKVNERRVLTTGEAIAGGLLGGFIDGKFGGGTRHEVWGIPTVGAVGALAAIVGMSEWIPGGEDILSIGAGMLSYSGGAYVRETVAE